MKGVFFVYIGYYASAIYEIQTNHLRASKGNVVRRGKGEDRKEIAAGHRGFGDCSNVVSVDPSFVVRLRIVYICLKG